MHPEILNKILTNLNETNAGIEASALITMTGLPIYTTLSHDIDEDSVSALSAAVISLGRRSLEELLCGNLEQIVITGEKGYVLLTQAGNKTLLAMQVRLGAPIDQILQDARNIPYEY